MHAIRCIALHMKRAPLIIMLTPSPCMSEAIITFTYSTLLWNTILASPLHPPTHPLPQQCSSQWRSIANQLLYSRMCNTTNGAPPLTTNNGTTFHAPAGSWCLMFAVRQPACSICEDTIGEQVIINLSTMFYSCLRRSSAAYLLQRPQH